MFARAIAASVLGVEAYPVDVEAEVIANQPWSFNIVGLPDAAVREAKDRVCAALGLFDLMAGLRRITVNLAPADLRKERAVFDLAMAVAVAVALRMAPPDRLETHAFLGELSLDGRIRPIKGVLSMCIALKRLGLQGLYLPTENAAEASLVKGLEVIPAESLEDILGELVHPGRLEIYVPVESEASAVPTHREDFADVRSQYSAKRALEVAAAGGHNLLMLGPPGSGKTMLARRFITILPEMTLEESLETTQIHSVAGMLPSGEALVTHRPFRSPHHTASDAGIVGGGTIPRPGEVSLAHNGVLFLDELPEFRRTTLETLRQPLEEGKVTVSRAAGRITFPARFSLLAAMNPCPCGYYGDPSRRCQCGPQTVQKYRSRISGPLLDRIDIHVEVPALRSKEMLAPPATESSATIRVRVNEARERQKARFREIPGIYCNAQMDTRLIRAHCTLDAPGLELLKTAVTRMGLSARAFDRILKLSRTIADLEGSDNLQVHHLAEAIQYRTLDREST